MEKTYNGAVVRTTDEGFLEDFTQWNRDVGTAIAQEEGITMTDDHWKVINFIQDQYRNDVPLTVRKIGKSGIVDIKQFYDLFPGGPLKKASRIAGIPKPVSCI